MMGISKTLNRISGIASSKEKCPDHIVQLIKTAIIVEGQDTKPKLQITK